MIVDLDTLLTCNAPVSPNIFAVSTDSIDLYPGRTGQGSNTTPGLMGMGEATGFLIEVTTAFSNAGPGEGVANIGVILSNNINAGAPGAEAVIVTMAAPFIGVDSGTILPGFRGTFLTAAAKFYMPIGTFSQAMLPGQNPGNLRYMSLIILNVAVEVTGNDAFDAGQIQGRIVNQFSHEMNDRMFSTGFTIS